VATTVQVERPRRAFVQDRVENGASVKADHGVAHDSAPSTTSILASGLGLEQLYA
jgi:hypothetical protein